VKVQAVTAVDRLGRAGRAAVLGAAATFVVWCPWAVMALVGLALLLRTWNVDEMSIWQDEGLSLYRAAQDVRAVLGGQIPLGAFVTRDVHPPLYFLLLAAWLKLAGSSTWAAKWLSILASLPVIPLLWALGRRWIDSRVGLMAAALAALSPIYLWYSQEIRSYALIVTLGLLAVYALLRAIDEHGDRRAQWAWAALCLGANVAMIWAHYLGFFLLAFELLVVLAVAVRRRHARRPLAVLLLAVLAAVPLLPFALRRLGLGPERDQHFVPLPVILQDIVRAFSLGSTVHHERWWWLQLLFGGLLLAGLVWLWRKRRPAALLLAGYLLVPVLLLFAMTLKKPVYLGAQHILLVSPAFYLLVAAGLWAVRFRSGWAALALAAVAGGAMLVADRNYYTQAEFHKDDLRGLAAYVDARAVPGDVLAVPHPVLKLAFDPLVRRLPVIVLPEIGPDGLQDDRPPAEQLAPLVARGRLWFMSPPTALQGWLEENALPADSRAFEGRTIPVRLEAFEARRLLPTQDYPPRAAWNVGLGGLRLLGWAAQPNPLVAGRAARVPLAWQAAAPALPDYKVALRLLDGQGNDFGQGDHEPYHGLQPTSTWPFGELVYEPHDLAVSSGTPPGTYQMAITVYDPATGATFPPDGPFIMGPVQVVRPPEAVAMSDVAVGHALDARGSGLRLFGYDLPTWRGPAGGRLPLALWLVATAPVDEPLSLRAEQVDWLGRVVAQSSVPLVAPEQPPAWVEGDLRKIPITLDLPARGGHYQLRARLLDPTGRTVWLRQGLLPTRGAWLGRIEVESPRRRRDLPSIGTPLNLLLGDSIELLGYDLGVESPQPGGELPVTLYWRPRSTPSWHYQVSVQLLPVADAAGTPAGPPLAQHDGVPGGGQRPTTGWLAGEVVSDEHTVQLPADLPPGRYLLIAALYDPAAADVGRLTTEQDGQRQDYAVLQSVNVGPAGTPPPSATP
jgi:4-amino-4-deoxy-L-arabinose transferase-like glycosyltransferase